LLAVAVQDLRSDSSAFYLRNINQVLTDTRRSDVVTPRAIANAPSTFSPPKYAIWVNTLWFLSLVISLTCALLATLINQWTRRYLRVTQSRYAPQQRARIRSFFFEGTDKLHLTLAAGALPTLLHLSVFLFFAGLVVFLFSINCTVFKFVAIWITICTVLYACLTFLPIFRHDSPYYTPLSTLAWSLHTGLLCVIFQSLLWLTAFNCFRRAKWVRFRASRDQYYERLSRGMEKAAEDFALGMPSDIDGRALLWTLRTLNKDDEIETFFEGIASFCNSSAVPDPQVTFKTPSGEDMSEALVEFMCNTLSSNLIPEPVKRRRIEICSKAVEAASLSINRRTFDRVLYKDWGGLLNSVEFGLLLRRVAYGDPFNAYYSQCVISVIVATVQERDARWFELAMHQLGVSETVLREYLSNGDSLLLADCISICRRTMHVYSQHGWHRDVYSQSKTLESLSKLDIRHTLPELQHDFCSLWNELVDSARYASDRRMRSLSTNILMHIRIMYIALHGSTSPALTQISIGNADFDPILILPFSYPLCNTPAHTPGLPYRADMMAASVTSLNDHNPRNSYPTVPGNDVTGTGNVADTLSVLTTNPSQTGIQVAGEPSPEHVRAWNTGTT